MEPGSCWALPFTILPESGLHLVILWNTLPVEKAMAHSSQAGKGTGLDSRPPLRLESGPNSAILWNRSPVKEAVETPQKDGGSPSHAPRHARSPAKGS